MVGGNHASASYATQSYVGTQISNLVDSSPAALNTLNELAAALGDDANFSTTVTNSIATKLPLAGGTMTGALNMGSQNITNTGTISSGRIAATNGIEAQGIWINNNQPSSNNAIYSGYGAIGNRGTFYITNSGNVQIGNGAGHNANPAATFTTAALILGANRVLQMNGTTIVDASRNLTNVNLVKFRDEAASFYISPTNANTLNAQHGATADSADMWINYRGYADGFTKFRDFRIGNGKGAALLHVDGSASTFDFQSGSTLKMNGTTFIDANRNITVGIINSGAITTAGNLTIDTNGADAIIDVKGNSSYDSVLRLRSDQGSIATEGFEIWYDNSVGDVHLNTTYPNDAASIHFQTRTGAGKSTVNKRLTINGNGNVDIVTGSLRMGTTPVIDSARNITAGTISSGNIRLTNNSQINLWTTLGASGTGKIHMPRGGFITFYGDESTQHSISSRNSAGAVTDDLRINSYGAVNINLDANNNNADGKDFLIGRHGGATGTLSDLFRIDGDTAAITTIGAIRQTISNVGIPTNYSSFTMEAADAQLDLVSSSAGTWGSAINFVEGASTTANTNNWSIARKTSGGGNTLNFNFGIANQHDNTTRMTFASDGAITATGYITGTRLRVSDGTNGYFYSDTAGRTAFSSGSFYLQTSVPVFYNYANDTYMGNTSGDTTHFRGNVITANNWGIPASGTITSTGIRTSTNQSRVKLGVWSDNTYGIGMQTNYTFGGINNNYAMTFQMNNDNARGFWWGDSTHTNSQGAMALTTNGLLTVASGIRVGYGETDTTIPSAGLDVNGSIASGTINTTSHVTIGTISTTNTGSLFLAGSTVNKKAELKCTNGNLHIDPDTTASLYLNYYKGTGGIFFGNGAASYRAQINTSGHLNLASTGTSPTGYALSVGNVGVISTARNIDNVGTIQTNGDVLINGTFAANPYANAGARLRFCGGTQPADYYIGTNLENVGGNYSKLDLRWHTGIRMGAQGVYGGIRFFNNEDLTTKLMSIGEGSGVTDVKVYNDLQVDAGIKVGSSATRLSQSGVQLKIQTTSGYCEIGPANGTWMHFETDRASFYFNTKITVDTGIVQSYNEDLILRRAQNSAHQLTVGTSGVTATGNVTAYSDERLKTNIQTLDSKKALQMRGVSFIKDGVEGSGVIAQEIEEIAPELVLTADDEMGTKSVAYGNLVGYLIETVKDQQKEIEYMKSEIKNLQENNNGDNINKNSSESGDIPLNG